MSAVLINPSLLAQRSDPLTTGVAFLPVGLASLAAALRQQGIAVTVLDAYGLAPFRTRIEADVLSFGLTPDEVVERLPRNASVVFLHADQFGNVGSLLEILQALKHARPALPVVVVENTHSVAGFALAPVARQFLDAGADYLLTGEPEETAGRLVRALTGTGGGEPIRQIPGLIGIRFGNAPGKGPHLDKLPFPAWDLFPLKNYWSTRCAHGPLSAPRYLPLLTSRGCPHPCSFCVAPSTTRQRWRVRSACPAPHQCPEVPVCPST
jgi:anaerobic magnesium-protoporphyrin IX monomethyl ester cyclase